VPDLISRLHVGLPGGGKIGSVFVQAGDLFRLREAPRDSFFPNFSHPPYRGLKCLRKGWIATIL
jgi:hypothetical protein